MIKRIKGTCFGWWAGDQGQAVAEYATMLGLLLALLFILSAIGLNTNSIFRYVASILD